MLNTPVLFLIFNRQDTTHLVFEKIKQAKPQKLFIAADGPRDNKEGEKEKCEQTRELVISAIDWDCEVKTLFRNENLGCGLAVSSAITWFFENVKQGIILEDDCLPLPGFFEFCEEMLNYYKNEAQVFGISGSNLQAGKVRGEGSYYFSNHVGIWGWATWARAWKNYNYKIENFDRFVDDKQIEKILSHKTQQKQWLQIFKDVGKFDTWDYQWVFTMWSKNGKYIIPNANLVKNIGFSMKGTHALNEPDWYKKLTRGNKLLFPIVHPISEAIFTEADEFLFTATSKRSFSKRVVDFILKIKRR